MERIPKHFKLSRQEEGVLLHSMSGLSDREIAQEMGIVLDTVRTYWQRIRSKAGGGTRAEVIARMVSEGAQASLDASRSENEALQSEVSRRRAAEERFMAIANAMPVGLFTTDEVGRCRYANREYLRINGQPIEAIVGEGWSEGIHPDDRDRVFQEWCEASALGEPYRSSHRFRHPDGTVLWTAVHASQVQLEGQALGYVGVVEDITDRHHAEENLRRQKRMVKDIAEASLDAFFVFEPHVVDGVIADFRLAYVSRNAELLFGRSDDEVRGQLLSEAYPERNIKAFVAAYRRVFESGEPFEIEVPTSGGISGRIVLIRASRIVDGIGVTVRDVTEHRRLVAEEARRVAEVAEEHAFVDAILGVAGCLICVLDRQARFVRVNAACERLSGWSAAELLGQSVFETVIPPEAHERVRTILDAEEPQRFPNSNENEWVNKDGRRRLIEWRNTALLDGEGRVQYVIATGIDITERRRAELELREAKEALELAQRISGVGSWAYDVGAERVEWSRAMFDIFGIESWDRSPKLEEVFARIHPDDVYLVRNELMRSIEFWVDSEFSFRIALPSGALRHVRCLSKADKGQGRLFGTLMDVSERVRWERQIEDAMLKTVEESVQLEVQKQELIDLNQRLDRLAVTDGLTELLNHRAFHEKLDEELQKARRHGAAVSLVMLDVDQFKRFNDDHGHQEGDRVLKGVAGLLKSMARMTDIVARYGGEEFVVILPSASPGAAFQAAERMRRAIESAEWAPFHVTASFGVATFRPESDTQEALIGRADAALYAAKGAGRNRVSHADLPAETARGQ